MDGSSAAIVLDEHATAIKQHSSAAIVLDEHATAIKQHASAAIVLDEHATAIKQHASAVINEIRKYEGIYQSAAHSTYGHSNHGSRAIGLLVKWQVGSVLDVGCGWNEFAGNLRAAIPSVRVVGVDAACPGADVKAEATALPFANREFKVVTAFDVLEHLPEVEIDMALAEMSRVADAFVFSISHKKSVALWQGENLHPTVRPEDWWIERIIRAGGIHIGKHGRYITGHWQRAALIRPDSMVAVVGNGPSVMKDNLGSFIDTHDVVVRFNNYKVAGFEARVGRRTDFWSTMGAGGAQFDQTSPPQTHLLVGGETGKTSMKSCEIIPRWFYNRVEREMRDRACWREGFNYSEMRATSGFIVVSWLLRIKGVNKLHLFGFDHFSKRHSGQHHYWVPKVYAKPKEHCGDTEAAMFEDLREAGRITYL